MAKYLIDACVLSGYLNAEDSHHEVCKAFFEAHNGERLYFSPLSLFEFQAIRSRRESEGTLDGVPPIKTCTCRRQQHPFRMY